jgi:hypothetical protein
MLILCWPRSLSEARYWGIVAQFALVYAVFGYVMPWLGLELLDMGRTEAAGGPARKAHCGTVTVRV